MAEKMDKRSRKWLIEINNPVEKGFTHEELKARLLQIKNLDYWCMCDEIGGKTKTYHTHIYIFRSNAIRWSQLDNLFHGGHWEAARGTSQQNRDYIRKEGKWLNSNKKETNIIDTFEESCDVPDEKQGERNDLHQLYDMIKEGYTDYEILEVNPSHMRNLDKIEKCRQIVKRKESANKIRDVEVHYIYGATGTGKTYGIMAKYGCENVYRITDTYHPWDMYEGQDVIVFEEFYSEDYKLQVLLNWLDKYPLVLPCRFYNRQAFFTKVYLTSNIPLDEQYHDVKINNRERWNAFIRRINTVTYYKSKEEILHYDDVQQYLHGFKPCESGPFGG